MPIQLWAVSSALIAFGLLIVTFLSVNGVYYEESTAIGMAGLAL